MVDKKAFTLIELIVVISILVLLMVIAIPLLSKYVKKYSVEKEITQIYSDIMEQRFKSMSSGVPHGIVFNSSTQYTIFKFDDLNHNLQLDGTNEETDTVVKSGLKYPLICRVWPDQNSVIMFDSRGIFRNKIWGGAGITIRINAQSRYNCIVISYSRIKMGVWDGSDCKAK